MGKVLWAYLAILTATSLVAQPDTQKSGNLLIAPLVFYTPETNLAFGPAMFLRFASSQESGQHASYVRLFGFYTLRQQWYGRLEGEVWGKDNDWKLRGDVNYSIYPYLFFGIGNETPASNRERYSQDRIMSRLEVSHRVKRGSAWYVGLVGELFALYNLKLPEGGILATGNIPGAFGGQLYAGGLLGNVDTRDHVYFPSTGWYSDFSLTGYLGDFRFAAWRWDVRRFVPLGAKAVLAVQLYQQLGVGTVPFQLMPQLGDENRFRGMVGGRFTDQCLQTLQAEFRMPVWWRLGITAFGAVGRVGAEPVDLLRVNGYRPALGVGTRFLFDREERINIRMDAAWTKDDGWNYYLTFREAF